MTSSVGCFALRQHYFTAVTNKAKNRKSLKFVTQNVRGLKSDSRIEELFSYINRFNVFASCIQETWRFGRENLQNGQCLLLTSGLEAEATSKRGLQEVGIVLNATAVEAWKKAGCELHTISSRVMADMDEEIQIKDKKSS